MNSGDFQELYHDFSTHTEIPWNSLIWKVWRTEMDYLQVRNNYTFGHFKRSWKQSTRMEGNGILSKYKYGANYSKRQCKDNRTIKFSWRDVLWSFYNKQFKTGNVSVP